MVGLLIAPSAHHRIAEDGEASHQFIRFLTRVSLSTLPIFAIAIGLDLGIAGMRIGGVAAGIAGAFLGVVLPLAIWFGPLLFHHPHEDEDMSTSDKKTPIDAKIDYVLTEARVVLPGAQALLGFQLAIVLTNGFQQLSSNLKMTHGAGPGLDCTLNGTPDCTRRVPPPGICRSQRAGIPPAGKPSASDRNRVSCAGPRY
ncbi:hypothetical protein [Bosea beijingensis]|uniref:hypothetical protein n=1 Tax=Bosea beijingensis TaxID=3068632 RepID=UPI002740A9E3|nr:hypothetical protein [Bosea sp. REN20]